LVEFTECTQKSGLENLLKNILKGDSQLG